MGTVISGALWLLLPQIILRYRLENVNDRNVDYDKQISQTIVVEKREASGLFPYDQIPVSRKNTSTEIVRYGEQSLLRSLNIGRSVAIVGSGNSLIFNQPSWDSLKGRAKKIFSEFNKQYEGNIKKLKKQQKDLNLFKTVEDIYDELLPLANEINALYEHNDSTTIEPQHFVELCEKYFEQFELLATQEVIVLFTSTDQYSLQPLSKKKFREMFSQQFNSLKEFDEKVTNTERDLKRLPDPLLLSEEIKNLRLRKTLLKYKPIFGLSDLDNYDTNRALFRDLKITRFLTLNYDLEIERMLLEESRRSPFGKTQEFLGFIGHDYDETIIASPGDAVCLSSASGNVLRSTSSRAKTLADLFSFGAFPTNFDSSVHHLHGRVDDPENMIITPRDYQKIYYGNSEQKKSFDEARHAVFTGSDAILIGMGHSENDVLRPLRDLLEFESNRVDSFGKVFYITTTNFGTHTVVVNAIDYAIKEAKSLSQRLFQEYGMHVIHADVDLTLENTLDDMSYRTAELLRTRALLACVSNIYFSETKDISSISDKNFEWCGIEDKRPDGNKTLKQIRALALEIEKYLREKKLSEIDRQQCGEIIRSLSTITISHGLVGFIRELSHRRQDWWRKWSEWPGPRLALYGPHNYYAKSPDHVDEPLGGSSVTVANTSNNGMASSAHRLEISEKSLFCPLVWRQTNMVTYFGPKEINLSSGCTPQFYSLIELTGEVKQQAISVAKESISCDFLYPGAIARVSMRPGSGKGRLVSFFSHEQKISSEASGHYPFTRLFNTGEQSCEYIGLFTAHLTFSIEFSSLITGLIRFIQLRLNILREECCEDPRWIKYINTQMHINANREPAIEILKELFAFLKEVCPCTGWKKRMIVIISNLDRMVDKNGDGYAPIHRLFFRLVSGWDDPTGSLKLPVDIVLVNSDARKPIRYLSIEKSIGDVIRAEPDNGWVVRKDRNCALKYWSEIRKVSKRDIFEEGLLFSLISLNSTNCGVSEKKSLIQIVDRSYIEMSVLNACIPQSRDIFNDWSLDLFTGLWAFLERRVSYGYMMAALAVELWHAATSAASDPAKEDRREEVFSRYWGEATLKLAGSVSKNGTYGFFDELFSIYRRLDRIRGAAGHAKEPGRTDETGESIAYERLRALVLDHLALFSYPVTAETLYNCPEIKSAVELCWGKKVERGDISAKEKKEYRSTLVSIVGGVLMKLSFRGFTARLWKYSLVNSRKREIDWSETFLAPYTSFVFGLDPRIASVVRAKANLSVYGHYNVVPFQTSLYMSQAENSVKPEISHFHRVSDVVRSLISIPHKDLLLLYEELCERDNNQKIGKAKLKRHERELDEYADSLRSAYALIRGTFSISVISRLDTGTTEGFRNKPFDEYRTWIRKALNAGILLTQTRKALGLDKEKISLNEPFFREEISWLYNERALVSFLQGRLFDALPLFEQSLGVTSTIRKPSYARSSTAPSRRIKLNQALAQLERGHIKVAQSIFESILEETRPKWEGETPSTLRCYATGYLALSHHLSDNYTNAELLYKEVINDLELRGFARAQSIFRRHFADLLRAMAKSRENESLFIRAVNELKASEELAMGIRAVDLQNYALIARARMNRDRGDRKKALADLRHAEKYALNVGLRKMRAEVLKVRGEVLLAEGEATQAGFVTSQSIAMSKRNGMRLRKISAVLIQAQILKIREQRVDARRLLKESLHESQTLGYTTKTSAAIQLLSDL